MIFFKKKCKECGGKITANGCGFCIMFERVIALERMYYRMGGFQIIGEINQINLDKISRRDKDIRYKIIKI